MKNLKKEAEKNKVVIKEIMSICDELGVKVSAKMPAEKNKFLSAWNKRATDLA